MDGGERRKVLSGLTKEQRTGFVLLLVFAILSAALGYLQIRNTLYAPFALSNAVPAIYQNQVNDINTLRVRDTDRDKISDFDELYVYGTSPYLLDTDGDKFSDYDEVFVKHTDPLCPEGKSCAAVSDTASASSTGAAIIGNLEPAADIATVQNDVNALLDPQKLRATLAASGISQADLSRVSDSELLGMMQQIIQNSSTIAAIVSSTAVTTSKP